ncbi:MAG: PD-(D/E)XK nuclease family protein [Deltaproteobacteria bacterium]|nr:PD-(D/E)XK nuclease family protein [Deltaproteobacteria bacterium]
MPLKQRKRNLYDPQSKEPFKLSRSKLENFVKCPRCFYLDRRLGIDRPSMPGFTLNTAVDALLKKEFDIYRAKKEPHPLMKEHGVKAIPFSHPDLNIWRENFKGLEYHHKSTNFIISGAIDDVWVTPDKKLIVVDYKATSKEGEITLDDEWKESYKRQMEIYQWILRGMGFEVQDTGYFVYANGRKDLPTFDGNLAFYMQLIPYTADSSWVEKAVKDAWACLASNTMPACRDECEFCTYRKLIHDHEN